MIGDTPSLPRPLSDAELRVLGVLLEKELATPDAYPLTLRAVIAACNQRSNREPVMELAESEVAATLEALFRDALVWRSSATRSERWRHGVERRWELTNPTKAILAELLLRGAQTPGELRSRCERMHPFPTLDGVLEALRVLGGGEEPLIAELPRAPGQKETRWAHLLGLEPLADTMAPRPHEAGSPLPAVSAPGVSRLDALEVRVEALERELAALVERLGGR